MLDLVTEKLIVYNKLNLIHKKNNFEIIKTRLESLSPGLAINNQRSLLNSFLNSLSDKQKIILKNKKQKLKLMHEKLIALNPREILNRGYSITFSEKGDAIDNADSLKQGQIVTTQLAKGKFKSRVEN